MVCATSHSCLHCCLIPSTLYEVQCASVQPLFVSLWLHLNNITHLNHINEVIYAAVFPKQHISIVDLVFLCIGVVDVIFLCIQSKATTSYGATACVLYNNIQHVIPYIYHIYCSHTIHHTLWHPTQPTTTDKPHRLITNKQYTHKLYLTYTLNQFVVQFGQWHGAVYLHTACFFLLEWNAGWFSVESNAHTL